MNRQEFEELELQVQQSDLPLKIETLRYRILLRYYELLLTLDVMTQPNEVKTLMGYINTLERYAKKYETKPVKKKSEKRKEYIDEIPVTDENTGS